MGDWYTITKQMIRLSTDAPGTPPQLREPTPLTWYVGVEVHPLRDGHSIERFGYFMQYTGNNVWRNEGDDPDFCCEPGAFDYLQEQVGGN